MYEIYPTSWPALGLPESAREAIDRKALYEARMTTDVRGAEKPAVAAGLVARLRSAFSAPQRVEACQACPA